MAKKKAVAKKVGKKPAPKRRPSKPTPEPVETPEQPREAPEADAEDVPRIAVDFHSNGQYVVVAAPDGTARAIAVAIDGVTYAHVDEYQGLWAYRVM